jgi:hypothetical protein
MQVKKQMSLALKILHTKSKQKIDNELIKHTNNKNIKHK